MNFAKIMHCKILKFSICLLKLLIFDGPINIASSALRLTGHARQF